MLAGGLAVSREITGNSAPGLIGGTSLYRTVIGCNSTAAKEPNERCPFAIG